MSDELVVKFIGDASGLKAATDKADNAVEGHSSKLHKLEGAAKLAATAGVGLLAVGLEKSVEAAQSAQTADANMEQQLKNSKLSYEGNRKAIDESLDSTSKLSAFTKTDLTNSFSNLVRTTGDVQKGLKDTALAADVARGKNMSLEAATKLVTAAEMGKTGALSRSGIQVDKVTAATDRLKLKVNQLRAEHVKFTPELKASIDQQMQEAKGADLTATKLAAVAALHAKFAGSADAYGKTSAGAMAKFKVAVEELEVKLGTFLLPILAAVATKAAGVAEWMERNHRIVKLVAEVVIPLAVGFIALEKAIKITAAAQEALNLVMDANPIMLVVTALAAIGLAFYEAYKHSQTFRDIVNGVFDSVKGIALGFVDFFTKTLPGAFETVLGWVRSHWPIIATILAGPFAPLVALATNAFGIRSAFTNAVEATLGWVRGHWREIATIMSGPFAPLVGLATNAFGIRSALTGAISAVTNFIGNKVDEIVGYFTKLPGRIDAVMKTAETTLLAMARRFGNDALKIGVAIASGVISGLAGLGDALYQKIKNETVSALGRVKGFFGISSPSTKWRDEVGKPFAEGITEGFLAGMASFAQTVTGVINVGIQAGTAALEAGFALAYSEVSTFAQNLLDQIDAAITAAAYELAVKLGKGLGNVHVSISANIPGLDKGGVVEKTGVAVVHRGEEYLGVGADRRSVGSPVTVNFHGPVYGGDKRKVAQELVDEIHRALIRKQNRNGTLGFTTG